MFILLLNMILFNNNKAIILMIIVPCIRAFGTILWPSFVSPAKNVGDSQPKKVSAIKNIARNTVFALNKEIN